MGARLARATVHLRILIQRADQWARAGGGAARRGRGRSQLSGSAARPAVDPGRGSAAPPARPGPGLRPERPPSPLQPRLLTRGPCRPSAPRRPGRAAGAPRPGLPAGTPRPRSCRCPRRRRYRAPGAGPQSALAAKMASGLHKLWAPGGGTAAGACPWVRGAGPDGWGHLLPGALPAAPARAGIQGGARRPQFVGVPSGSGVGTGGPGPLLPLSTPGLQGSAVSGGFAGLEFATPQEPEPRDPGTWAGAAAGAQTPSMHRQVPAHR